MDFFWPRVCSGQKVQPFSACRAHVGTEIIADTPQADVERIRVKRFQLIKSSFPSLPLFIPLGSFDAVANRLLSEINVISSVWWSMQIGTVSGPEYV